MPCCTACEFQPPFNSLKCFLILYDFMYKHGGM
jgi:hypothetical protein